MPRKGTACEVSDDGRRDRRDGIRLTDAWETDGSRRPGAWPEAGELRRVWSWKVWDRRLLRDGPWADAVLHRLRVSSWEDGRREACRGASWEDGNRVLIRDEPWAVWDRCRRV